MRSNRPKDGIYYERNDIGAQFVAICRHLWICVCVCVCAKVCLNFAMYVMQYSINLDFALFITSPNLFVLFELKESYQRERILFNAKAIFDSLIGALDKYTLLIFKPNVLHKKFRQSFCDAVYGNITVKSEQSFETAKLYARIFNISYLTIQHKVKQ